MNVLNSIQMPIPANNMVIAEQTAENNKPQQQPVKYKTDIFDKISSKVINKDDITDTVTMPRTIFKGYLCFTAGTAINAISGMITKHQGLKKYLGIIGSLISIYGTYNFVKPFLIRGKELTNEEK